MSGLVALGSGVAAPHPAIPVTVVLEEPMGEAPDAADIVTGKGDLKLFRIVHRKAGLDLAQFRAYWHHHHEIDDLDAPFIGGQGMKRVLVSFSTGSAIIDNELSPIEEDQPGNLIDSTVEIYYEPSADPWKAYATIPLPAAIRRDEVNFINFDLPARRAIVQEYVIE
jgi:hypothetical protein